MVAPFQLRSRAAKLRNSAATSKQGVASGYMGRHDRRATPLGAMNKRADWFAWILQFIVGFGAGALFSVLFLRGGRRSIPIITRAAAPMFALGMGLVGASLASYAGDRLWIGDNYRIIPPDEPRHSPASLGASFGAGVVGSLLVLVALARSFGWMA